MNRGMKLTEQHLLDLGFTPLKKDSEWPYTMIYERGEYTIQFKPSWGQGDEEEWILKRNGFDVQTGCYILTIRQLVSALYT